MVIVMWIAEVFGRLCLRIFGVFVSAVDLTAGQEFVRATEKGAEERKALYKSEREAIARMRPEDQALMWLADGKIAQARAAKRKYWKNSDPMAYARLYKKLGFSEDELNYEMTVVERMPGYFRKNVRAAMDSIK